MRHVSSAQSPRKHVHSATSVGCHPASVAHAQAKGSPCPLRSGCPRPRRPSPGQETCRPSPVPTHGSRDSVSQPLWPVSLGPPAPARPTLALVQRLPSLPPTPHAWTRPLLGGAGSAPSAVTTPPWGQHRMATDLGGPQSPPDAGASWASVGSGVQGPHSRPLLRPRRCQRPDSGLEAPGAAQGRSRLSGSRGVNSLLTRPLSVWGRRRRRGPAGTVILVSPELPVWPPGSGCLGAQVSPPDATEAPPVPTTPLGLAGAT